MAFPRVKVLEGELEGRLATSLEGRDYYSFQGIPYAEPPVGKLRFKPPVPKQPWTGIYDAYKAGESSAQFDLVNRQYVGSEDCLFLNVFTPRLPCQEQEDELLPVMFFIHGGGFVNGSGNADQLGPDFIISKDTIMVTINYRLGVFGFLSLDIPEAPGNNGLKDQNLALKWVQKNIRAFNGDPDNITIFGISAGSASVEYHMLSPMSEGLFNKAILQSGSSLNPWARTRNPTKLVGKLTAKLGVSYEDPVECFKYLQNLDAEKLILTASISADDESVKDCEMFPFGPVVEKTFEGIDAFLTEEPLQLLMSGRFHHVPTITGFCENEGNLMKLFYAKNIKAMGDRNFIDYLPSKFEVDRVHYDTRFRETYDYKDDDEAIDAFLSDLCFVGGIYQSLLFRLRNNHLENYMYMFTHDGKLNYIKQYFKISGKGAFHGDDTTYLGSNESMKDITPTDEDIKVRSRMVQMWTDFAKSGNPTPNESSLITTEWLPITSHHTILMEIGEELKMNKLPFCERLSLWESLYSSSIIPY